MAFAKVQVCEGQELHYTVPLTAQSLQQPSGNNPRPINIQFTGKNGNGMQDRFVLTEKLLSQHLMLIGGIGSGKTNTFNQILQNIIPQLTSRDVMIIFDTKGDFYKEFYKPGDVVISNDNTACGPNGPNYWNILSELENSSKLREEVIEISNALFADKLKNAGNNAFFPQAGKDIMSAVLYHFALRKKATSADNFTISEAMKKESLGWYSSILSMYSQYAAMQSYIPKEIKTNLSQRKDYYRFLDVLKKFSQLQLFEPERVVNCLFA